MTIDIRTEENLKHIIIFQLVALGPSSILVVDKAMIT